MPPPPSFWFPGPGISVIAAAIITVASVIIFIKTKELYELTSHQGIRFFRYAFLFFGVTFLVQLLRPAFRELAQITLHSFRPISLLLLTYAGTMAILCLLYSVLWRRMTLRYPFLLLTMLAVLIALVTWIGRLLPLVLILQLLLFVIVLIISYLESRDRRSKALQVHVLYTLLFFSWVASEGAHFAVWDAPVLALLLNIVSAVLFLVILWRVLRITAAHK